jgi:hypothetical protein
MIASLTSSPSASTSASTTAALDNLQARFLMLLPKIERCARFHFRGVECAATRADRVAEVVAMCWKSFVRLAEQGKDGADFVTTLATLAARGVKSGRRLCGQERSKDVMSSRAQRRNGFRLTFLRLSTSYPCISSLVASQEGVHAYHERLTDNTVTPPPDAAAFRLDFPRFLGGLDPRDRDLAMYLSLGHKPVRAATKFGLSPGRVTQLRQRWCRDWHVFTGDEPVERHSQPDERQRQPERVSAQA